MKFSIKKSNLILILSFCVYTKVIGINKCCKNKEVLVEVNDTLLLDTILCTEDSAFISQGQFFRHHHQPDKEVSIGLPICDGIKQMNYFKLDGNVSVTDSNEGCIDYFYDEKTRSNFTVFVKCTELYSNRLLEIDNETKPLPEIENIPNVDYDNSGEQLLLKLYRKKNTYKSEKKQLKFPKCCEEGKVYDKVSKSCVSSEFFDFDKVFNNSYSVDVFHENLICNKVLADYSISPENIYYDKNEIKLSLPWNEDKKNFTITGTNGCLDAMDENIMVARICQNEDYCETNACISVCNFNARIDKNVKRIEKQIEERKSNFQETFDILLENNSSLADEHFDKESYGLVYSPCSHYYCLDDNEPWHVGPMGEIIVHLELENMTYSYDKSCFAFRKDKIKACLCFSLDEFQVSKKEQYSGYFYGSLGIISTFFLGLTFFVYAVLPSLHNLHGMTLMCHVFSLIMAYLTLANVYLNPLIHTKSNDYADVLCKVMAYSMMFWFLLSFFWLSVMCFDIWWTFGGIQNGGGIAMSVAMRKRRERRRFFAYCLYACGLSLFFTAAAGITNYTKIMEFDFGKTRCWFEMERFVRAKRE